MKKVFLVAGLFILLILILFFAFRQKKTIIGKWKSIDTNTEFYYTFNEDKSCFYKIKGARLDCTYELDQEKLTILYKGNNTPIEYEYYFEKKNLIIIDDIGKNYKFTRSR